MRVRVNNICFSGAKVVIFCECCKLFEKIFNKKVEPRNKKGYAHAQPSFTSISTNYLLLKLF